MEVLVHISAPSSRADDDRYTLQARNYLAHIGRLRRQTGVSTENKDETQANTVVNAGGQEENGSTPAHRRASLDSSYCDDNKLVERSSGDSDLYGYGSIPRERAPSFPFPDSGVTNTTPSAVNEAVHSFASASSVFTAASSFVNSQSLNRKRSLGDISSFSESEPAGSVPQRRRLNKDSGYAPVTPLVSALDDSLRGDTTEIALAIAEAEQRRAADQVKDVQQHGPVDSYGQVHENVQDVRCLSQRTESLLGSSPCDGRETERETTQSKENNAGKGMLLVTPKVPKYMPPPIIQEASRRNSLNSHHTNATDRKSSGSEHYCSAPSTVSYSCELVEASPRTLSERTKPLPTKSGPQCQILPSSQKPVPTQPLSSLPLMHTPLRPPKKDSLRSASNVTFALQYLISNPLLLKHYDCSSPKSSGNSSNNNNNNNNNKNSVKKSSAKKKTAAPNIKHQSRSIQPLERGYWSLDPSPWPPALQYEFWTYLGRVIPAGRAGWGVWCVRECPDHQNCGDGGNGGHGEGEKIPQSAVSTSSSSVGIADSENDKGKLPFDSDPGIMNTIKPTFVAYSSQSSSSSSSSLGPLKVFCWGETVPHIYLLLYVASRRALRNIEARWVDVKGEIVVTIGPAATFEQVQA